MSDKITIAACRGGLNEESSDTDIGPGEVRRSSNYEQVAAGGYKRIGGSVKWSGYANTPDYVRIALVETKNPYSYPAGYVWTLDRRDDYRQSSSTKTEFELLIALFREDTVLWVVEKRYATDYFESNELLTATEKTCIKLPPLDIDSSVVKTNSLLFTLSQATPKICGLDPSIGSHPICIIA